MKTAILAVDRFGRGHDWLAGWRRGVEAAVSAVNTAPVPDLTPGSESRSPKEGGACTRRSSQPKRWPWRSVWINRPQRRTRRHQIPTTHVSNSLTGSAA
jgi:hypothetical protein